MHTTDKLRATLIELDSVPLEPCGLEIYEALSRLNEHDPDVVVGAMVTLLVERDRRRALLERCLAVLDSEGAGRLGREPDGAVVKDLWQELGIR